MTITTYARRLAGPRAAVAGLALTASFAGVTPASAVGGCTVVAPALSCMYSCVVGETQHVKVTGTDVTGRADCGFGVAQCYAALGDVACASSGSQATFSDTYWRACSVSPGGAAAFWVVACQSG